MRLCAMILAALAGATLNWSDKASSEAVPVTSAEHRLAHISVVKKGKGAPVVLIPGLSTPRGVWDDLAPELAKRHTVYLVQVNGFAGDDPGANGKDGMLKAIVEELHGTLRRDAAAPAAVIGHSLGGLMGMMLASAHPDDVGKLMIVDSLPFAGAMFDEESTVEAIKPMLPLLKGRMAAGYRGAEGQAAAEATAKSLTAKPQSAERVLGWIKAAHPGIAAAAMADALTTDMRPALKSIAAPVTVLHPAPALGKDPAATKAFYRRQYAGADAELVGIPDAGHFIMLDQPDRFAEEVKDFLR
ncbi:MAG TPA: alpha/beta hydrolase [Sphingomicrobium sp.]|nr:alpha/beta hydrolase [Sphingomicrobium sp.]